LDKRIAEQRIFRAQSSANANLFQLFIKEAGKSSPLSQTRCCMKREQAAFYQSGGNISQREFILLLQIEKRSQAENLEIYTKRLGSIFFILFCQRKCFGTSLEIKDHKGKGEK
jgi:hypothetical protein